MVRRLSRRRANPGPGCDGQGACRRSPSGEERRPASTTVTVPGRRIFRFDPGWNTPTLELSAALALLVWATCGRLVGHGLSMLTLRSGTNPPSSPDVGQTRVGSGKPESKRSRKQKARRQKQGARVQIVPEADEDPSGERTGEVHTIRRPDGSELRVECYGPPDAPPIVWTHGWGANSTEWFYQKRYLADRFRLIVWDEPGLGLSKKPDNNDYRLENLAADLDAVLAFAGDRPAVLVGHSIGGMITLTFCKEFPEALGTRVAGLVLVHTTYTNPVRTTQMAGALHGDREAGAHPADVSDDRPLAARLADELDELLQRLRAPVHAQIVVLGQRDAGPARLRREVHAARTARRPGQGDARDDRLRRNRGPATDQRADAGRRGRQGHDDARPRPESSSPKHVPGARLVTLSPAKHMGLIEHHDRFDRLVAEFAEKCQHAAVKG